MEKLDRIKNLHATHMQNQRTRKIEVKNIQILKLLNQKGDKIINPFLAHRMSCDMFFLLNPFDDKSI